MPHQLQKNNGIIKTALVVAVVLCATVFLGKVFLSKVEKESMIGLNALTHDVTIADFVASVNEAGEIESSSNIDIRCQVKGRGRAGTTILEIVPEGTIVKKGDFLCQFDDSVMREELTERKISVAKDESSLIQAKSDFETAIRTLDEFENGTFEQERAELEAQVALAEESSRRAREYRDYSEGLNRKGYITKTQLEADTFAAEKAVLDLKLSRQKLKVFEEFTQDRMIAELKAEIRKQEANVKATEFTLELSIKKQSEIEQQIAACRVVAPDDGMVVYASENDRRDSAIVIEEGSVVRDGQAIFRLPDPTRMQVRTMVNDSKINKVKEGMPALIRVDTDPEQPIQGVVRKVSSFPQPRRWFQAPIEYEVFVDITEESSLIRSGLRGKVEIFFERIDDVVQAPISSLVRHEDKFFVLVKTSTADIEPRLVEIGSNNDKFVVIKDGLKAGEQVLVDADNYIDAIEFPAAS